MARITSTESAEQATAVIRETVPLAELPAFFARAFAAVAAAAGQQGVPISGPPFAKYIGMPTDRIDVEAGFPVAQPIEAAGQVRASRLPGGRVYEAIHIGPYEALPQIYGEIAQQMAADGVAPADEMWEIYLSEPVGDPQDWRTRVCWPARP